MRTEYTHPLLRDWPPSMICPVKSFLYLNGTPALSSK
jgi:hypothetical protein